MAIEGDRNNRVVWHDIRPVAPPPKTPPRKTKLIRRLLLAFQLRRRPAHLRRGSQLTITHRTTAILITALVCLAASAAVSASILRNSPIASPQTANKTNSTSPAQPANQPPGLVKGTPSYPTLLPAGKTISSLGGWVRPGDKSVFVYIDTINTIPINVSEQPLPDDFKADTSQQMDLLAKAEKANGKITVGATTVYIGSTAKGPQSVFFTKNNLLFLIKSDAAITNDQWAAYVNSLQ